jgi:peptidoglycan/LPS O-acetylase OafA/YrhL
VQDLTAPGHTLKPVTPVRRLGWLDGVRALAATYVVLHHVWLMSYGGYPGNNGPWWTGCLVYGHLAVSVFIVVSGYSLTLSPAGHGMRLMNGGGNFLRRRFWRIVPPYWAALAASALLIVGGVIGSPSGDPVTGLDVLIHFLLLQDALGNTPPNGVFWSIAVEWHIYFLFPLLVLCMRRYGIARTMPPIVILVVVQHVVGQFVPVLGTLDRFSTAYFVLFVAGASAAWLSMRGVGARCCVLTAGMLGAGFIAAAALAGSEWIVSQYFWVDLAVGGAAAALLTALDQGRLRWIAAVLSTRPLVFVGQFAFSLYLVHAPVLEVLRVNVVMSAGITGAAAFWTLAGLGIPAALGAAYLFFLVCERPFLTIRGFGQLVTALQGPFRRPFDAGTRSPVSAAKNARRENS